MQKRHGTAFLFPQNFRHWAGVCAYTRKKQTDTKGFIYYVSKIEGVLGMLILNMGCRVRVSSNNNVSK